MSFEDPIILINKKCFRNEYQPLCEPLLNTIKGTEGRNNIKNSRFGNRIIRNFNYFYCLLVGLISALAFVVLINKNFSIINTYTRASRVININKQTGTMMLIIVALVNNIPK